MTGAGRPRWARFIGSTQSLVRERHRWDSVVFHDPRLFNIPAAVALPLVCGPVKGALRNPDELTIVLVHNDEEPPLLERGLRYVGIDDFVVLRPEVTGEWRDTTKILALLDWLRAGGCRTEFVLYVDSRDALLRAAPWRAVTLLRELDCDCIFSSTAVSYGYACMPDVKAWADENARQHGYRQRYINAGVFVGRATFVRELFEEAVNFIGPDDWPRRVYRRHVRAGTLCEALPDFPHGVGTDQPIIRYLHPLFYPRLHCDYAGRLAVPR